MTTLGHVTVLRYELQSAESDLTVELPSRFKTRRIAPRLRQTQSGSARCAVASLAGGAVRGEEDGAQPGAGNHVRRLTLSAGDSMA